MRHCSTPAPAPRLARHTVTGHHGAAQANILRQAALPAGSKPLRQDPGDPLASEFATHECRSHCSTAYRHASLRVTRLLQGCCALFSSEFPECAPSVTGSLGSAVTNPDRLDFAAHNAASKHADSAMKCSPSWRARRKGQSGDPKPRNGTFHHPIRAAREGSSMPNLLQTATQ